jgi:hypothetical protein
MILAAPRKQKNSPLTLTAFTRSQCSGSSSQSERGSPIAALLTRMPSRPSCSAAPSGERFGGGGVRQVDRQGRRAAAQVADRARRLIDGLGIAVGIAVGDEHVGAVLHEAQRDLTPDALTGARHERHLSFASHRSRRARRTRAANPIVRGREI